MTKKEEDNVRRRSTIQVLEYARSLDAYNRYGKADISKNIAWLKKQDKQKKQVHFPKFTFDDVLALQCCMETVKKVQEDKELYERLNLIHSKIYDAYRLEKQGEQASLQNNNNIDLTKILKDCPKGWKFYSDKYGEVTFWGFSDLVYPIQLNTKNNGAILLSEKGEEIIGNGKCILFPSKNQRDWSKFTAPWDKKDKFDPKTLNPFDKVLGRDSCTDIWRCTFYSHTREDESILKYITIDSSYKYCIPYNDDTKHLVGTRKEEPEYYKYWKD